MKQSELCDIKFCKNKTAEACVWHHHNDPNCNFNPFTDKEDESHLYSNSALNMQRNIN